MIEPQVQWVAPASLWPGYVRAPEAEDRARVRRPEILRFATDRFMDEFMGTLAHAPHRLYEFRAEPETWNKPSLQPAPVTALPPILERLHQQRLATAVSVLDTTTEQPPALSGTVPPGQHLKLYQPSQQRFYLVSACLVCRVPGLPDRVLDLGAFERVGFVVRRLRPKEGSTALPSEFDLHTCDEYAFVDGNRWQKCSPDEQAAGEQVLPMFGVNYTEHDGRRRRVLAGTIPVGKREDYVTAKLSPILPGGDLESAPDSRKALLLRKVTDPWRLLVDYYDKAIVAAATAPDDAATNEEHGPDPAILRRDAKDQADLLSWLVLLDLSDFLERYLPSVWAVVDGSQAESTLNGHPSTQAVYSTLKNTYPSTDSARSLAQALVDIRSSRATLDTAPPPYSTQPGRQTPAGVYPDFVFPLYDANLRSLVIQPEGVQTFDDRVAAALATVNPPARMPPLPLAAELSELDVREPGWFVIRCVFERPNCVPITAALLSEATEPFQMASFFDADAPARPIRIGLPIDISPSGLRKFDRNTAFMMSDALCGVVGRVGKLTFGDLVLSVLPWPFHKDLPNPDTGACETGIACSLSIPIITICALILLIIIVSLLNVIFWWIPFFMNCFKLPNFSAKES